MLHRQSGFWTGDAFFRAASGATGFASALCEPSDVVSFEKVPRLPLDTDGALAKPVAPEYSRPAWVVPAYCLAAEA